MGRYQMLVHQFWQDRLGQLIAEIYTPLVEGIDLPDDALHEDLVFVERNQGAERARIELLEQYRIGGPITRKCLVQQQPRDLVGAHARRAEFCAHFLASLAAHQSLGLSKDVRQQNAMMVADGVVTVDGREELAGNEPCALVDE